MIEELEKFFMAKKNLLKYQCFYNEWKFDKKYKKKNIPRIARRAAHQSFGLYVDIQRKIWPIRTYYQKKGSNTVVPQNSRKPFVAIHLLNSQS